MVYDSWKVGIYNNKAMNIVKVKDKYQVTIPANVREEAGIEVGDILDAKMEKGKIIFTRKSIIDQRLAEAIADVRAGRTYGPFNSAQELIASLHKNTSKPRSK